MHEDHKQLDAEHEKLGLECDRQQEKIKEILRELTKITEGLVKVRTQPVATAKALAEAAKQKTELNQKHYEETEWAKMALDKVQTTYQTQLLNSEVQVQDTATLIKKMKDEKKDSEDNIKLGVEEMRMIVTTWKNRTKANIYVDAMVKARSGITCGEKPVTISTRSMKKV